MTPEQKQLLHQADDLAKHAAQEAANRIMQIACLADDRRLAVMIGIKATKNMLSSFVMSAVEECGMPRDAAEITANAIHRHLMENISDHFDEARRA